MDSTAASVEEIVKTMKPAYAFLYSWWFIVLIINAVIGLIILELTWCRVIKYRRSIKELDDLFPAFRRDDSHHWKKWLLYPGAMTVMIPRFILLLIFMFTAACIDKLLLICHDPTRPMSRFRKCLIRCNNYFWWRCIGFFCCFTWHTYRYLTHDDVNYSEYLGTNEPQMNCQSIGKTMKEFYSIVRDESARS